MPLDESHVGSRVVVRSVVPGERGPTGGPAFTDVIGMLRTYDHNRLVVERADGTLVRVPAELVVAAKPVPSRPAPRRPPRGDPPRDRRLSSTAAEGKSRIAEGGVDVEAGELQRICAEGWPALESARLGDWLLRSSGGFTGRANSALAHGDPGMPFVEATERIVDFYRSRGRTPLVQTVVGSFADDTFVNADWHMGDAPDHFPIVQVATLSDALVAARARSGAIVLGHADDSWLGMYNRAADADPRVVRAVLEGPTTVAFAALDDTAIGRMVVTGQWAGMSAVEVRPDERRQGLATMIVDALLHWASGHGARWCYLQTLGDNVAAINLYARYGFRTHHAYRYLQPPP